MSLNRASKRTAGVGVIGLLAVTGGLVANSAPTWAASPSTSNQEVVTVVNKTGFTLSGQYYVGVSASNQQTVNAYVPAGSPVSQTVGPTLGQWLVSDQLGSTDLYFSFGAGWQSSTNSGTPVIGLKCGVSIAPLAGAAANSAVFVPTISKGGTTCTLTQGHIAAAAAAQPVTAIRAGGAARYAHARFVANTVAFKGGKLQVPVATYAKTGKAVKERIVLRDLATGKKIAARTVRLGANKTHQIAVGVNAKTKKAIRVGKVVEIDASIKHVGRAKGSNHQMHLKIVKAN